MLRLKTIEQCVILFYVPYNFVIKWSVGAKCLLKLIILFVVYLPFQGKMVPFSNLVHHVLLFEIAVTSYQSHARTSGRVGLHGTEGEIPWGWDLGTESGRVSNLLPSWHCFPVCIVFQTSQFFSSS